MEDPPSPAATPYQLMGNSEALVRAIVATFYRRMAEAEPELAATHELDAHDVTAARERYFALNERLSFP